MFARKDRMVRQIRTLPFKEYLCLQSARRTARPVLNRDDLIPRRALPFYPLRPPTLSPLQREHLWSLSGGCVFLLGISLGFAGPERARWLFAFLIRGLVLSSS